MSVYTAVDAAELSEFLTRFDIGDLVEHRGISAGIENTNYFVDTSAGSYVLTLFEATAHEGLPFFLDLMAFLAEHDLPTAHPQPDREGRYLQVLKDRPAAIVVRLEGASVEAPNPRQCAAIGDLMGRMHVATQDFGQRREDDRGLAWRRLAAERIEPRLPETLKSAIADELTTSAQLLEIALPSGVIHADLFVDNALFVGDEVTGVIDFYYAFHGALLYDLAVLMNDWCGNADGTLDLERAGAVASAYQAHRPLRDEEIAVWPTMMRHAASRFWLSRLVDALFPRPGELTQIKDPETYQRIVAARRDGIQDVRQIWS